MHVSNSNETWNLLLDSLAKEFKHKNVPKKYKSEIMLELIGDKASNVIV